MRSFLSTSRPLRATASVLLALVLGNSVHASPRQLHPEQEAALRALGSTTDDTKNIAPIAMTKGFSQTLFDELGAQPARRIVNNGGWTCGVVGKVPVLNVGRIRGVFEPFEFWGSGDMVEPEAQVAAIAAEGGQAVVYVSTDGGETGFTALMGKRTNTKSAPLRRMPAGGAYPSRDTTPCGRFEATSGLSASVQRAVEAKASWSWTAANGSIVEFTFDNGSLVHKSSAAVMPGLYAELQAALRKSLGVRPWLEMYVAKTKPEWSPATRAIRVTTFEGANGQQFVMSTIPVTGKAVLRLGYEQQPAGPR